jgi:Bacterial type II/III secretion system short domain
VKRSLLLLLLLAPVALAQGTLEVIPLRHRTADQVLPVLRPLLEPGGAMSGQYNQLIVRTSPDNLAQIRAALDAIDQPIRRLEVSVRFDSAQASARASVDADVRISNRGSSADLRIENSRSARDERVNQRLQVLEGGQAFISTGESRIFGEAATGFAIVPRISGPNVFLDILAQQENFARGGTVQGQRALGMVSGRLGDWIELSGTDASATRSGSGNLSSRERSAGGASRIWVKVEEIRN